MCGDMRVAGLVPCLAVVCASCAAGRPPPSELSTKFVANDEPKPSVLCPNGAPSFVAADSPEGIGLFEIFRDGGVTPPTGRYTADEIKFELHGATPAAELRVDLVDPNDPDDKQVLACGLIHNNVVRIPDSALLEPGSLLQLSLFDKPLPHEQDASEGVIGVAIDDAVIALAPMERDAVHRHMLDLPYETGLATTLRDYLEHVLIDPTPADVTAAIDVIGKVIADDERGDWEARETPLAPTIASEIDRTEDSLEAIAGILRTALATSSTANPIGNELMKDKLADAIAALPAPIRLLDGDRERYCAGVGKLRWLVDANGSYNRLITRAQIPYVASHDLVVTTYGHDRDDEYDMSRKDRLGFLVLDAPVGKPGSFATRRGNRVNTDAASLLLAALPYLAKAAPGEAMQRDLLNNSDHIEYIHGPEGGPPPDDGLSLVCRGEPHQAVVVDTAIEPTAAIEARGYTFGPIPRDYATEIDACDGSGCTDDKLIKSRVSLVPTQQGRFTLLGEVAFDLGLGYANSARLDGFGFRGQASPTFQPILGTSGPDQAYELEQTVTPRNAMSTALLLAFHIPQLVPRISPDWIVAAGPSLTIGSSGAVLGQVNLHLGVRLWPNVFLTFGPSVRFVPVPTQYRIGDVTSVPLPTNGAAPSAPIVDTREAALIQLDVGLAIDLGGAATAVGSAISSLGGAK
jgi:hypothetical protein